MRTTNLNFTDHLFPNGTNHLETLANSTMTEILFITSFPPRECGIATYSQDLIKALNNKFRSSFRLRVCPLESENERHLYNGEQHYSLNVDEANSFTRLAFQVNKNQDISMVLVQHEFGFFDQKEALFQQFLQELTKPVILVFHTVLPGPDAVLLARVKEMANAVQSIVVMTQFSQNVLIEDYGVSQEKIMVIPHGTHLVPHKKRSVLKEKYGLTGRQILSTFGLLSSGKSIETTLNALPEIVRNHPDVLFLIIGKTHPSVVKREGEVYRQMLEKKVVELGLVNNVRFINCFVPLSDLLEYLQLSDVYLFTSKDPNQAVSGTFSYAISCGCPVVSTPIPHAKEVLKDNAGISIDFGDSTQLSAAVLQLLADEQLRKNISSNGLHRMASTAWENAALAHAVLFRQISVEPLVLQYKMPAFNLDHVKNMTTGFGMIQFAKINQPDMESGYTLDDNARAMVAMCQHYELTEDEEDLAYIQVYLEFIKFCLQSDYYFLNYVNEEHVFTDQNHQTNLADANGRAIWALGYLISLHKILPRQMVEEAESTVQKALLNVNKIHSTRAMAFVIKGLYYRNVGKKSPQDIWQIKELANRLVQMYRHEAGPDWMWFESYLTYGNSILPEALICAWMATGEPVYKELARASFDFLLSKTFLQNRIKVISNQHWLQKGEDVSKSGNGGEQPIDVAYTLMALAKFYHVFQDEAYRAKMEIAFSWFLGNNHLNQIIYNPCTGGCYDGLEGDYVNLNQGAESTVSYLMARLTMEKLDAVRESIPLQIENRHMNLELV